ncbi:efflux transporter [Striga asiatica]|uniref:Efflux transporter n=1 Tax=Striga asiatica TaxID=4170 RepID=A0A5A7PRW3_STRAF|nr:efflux transporter [Striga asiatica]
MDRPLLPHSVRNPRQPMERRRAVREMHRLSSPWGPARKVAPVPGQVSEEGVEVVAGEVVEEDVELGDAFFGGLALGFYCGDYVLGREEGVGAHGGAQVRYSDGVKRGGVHVFGYDLAN